MRQLFRTLIALLNLCETQLDELIRTELRGNTDPRIENVRLALQSIKHARRYLAIYLDN